MSCDAGDGGGSLLIFGCTIDAIVGGDVAGDVGVLPGPSERRLDERELRNNSADECSKMKGRNSRKDVMVGET